jgi:DNA-directed RNA polymerase subunit RPC12/RpoP
VANKQLGTMMLDLADRKSDHKEYVCHFCSAHLSAAELNASLIEDGRYDCPECQEPRTVEYDGTPIYEGDPEEVHFQGDSEYLCTNCSSYFSNSLFLENGGTMEEGADCPNCHDGQIYHESSEVHDDEWNEMIDGEASRGG